MFCRTRRLSGWQITASVVVIFQTKHHEKINIGNIFAGSLIDATSQFTVIPVAKSAQKAAPVKNEAPRQSPPAVMYIEEPEYVEESPPAPVERVNQTAMEIINEDINRHRRSSGKTSKNKFGSIDAVS